MERIAAVALQQSVIKLCMYVRFTCGRVAEEMSCEKSNAADDAFCAHIFHAEKLRAFATAADFRGAALNYE
jgi:hypothetical protein